MAHPSVWKRGCVCAEACGALVPHPLISSSRHPCPAETRTSKDLLACLLIFFLLMAIQRAHTHLDFALRARRRGQRQGHKQRGPRRLVGGGFGCAEKEFTGRVDGLDRRGGFLLAQAVQGGGHCGRVCVGGFW
jgi:hypothetical protein